MSKLHKRKAFRWSRATRKVNNRKNNPPPKGIVITLQERNRALLNKLAAELENK